MAERNAKEISPAVASHGESTCNTDASPGLSQVQQANSRHCQAPLPGRRSHTSTTTGECGRSLPEAVKQFADMLRRQYTSAKVQLGRGMSAKPNKHSLDKIYVNLVVVPREELSSLNEQTFFGSQNDMQKLSHVFSRVADRVTHVELASMFDFDESEMAEDESVRVLAVACAGAGKTTVFLLKGPLDWARGVIWHEFDVVSALALRDRSVRHASNIIDLLRLEEHGIVDKQEQKEIAAFIHANPHRLLIVFDGLDETVLDDCSDFVRGIICGEKLKGVRVLLTSRHSAEVMKLSTSCPFDRRVEVLGFTKENVREYVNNVLPCEQAERLLEQVDGDPSLLALMQTPFFTQSTCDVYRSCGSVPSSLFGIFTALILSVIRQNTGSVHKDWSSVGRVLREQILELGHFAFLMLVEKKILFTDADLEGQKLSGEARSLGLLVACEPLSYPSVNQWQFSHLSIQECLASHYIACSSPNAGDIEFLVRQVGALTGHLSTFWCLLASQLTPDVKEALIAAILTQPVPLEDDIEKLSAGRDVIHFLRSSEDDLVDVAEVLCDHLDQGSVDTLVRCLLTDLLPTGETVAQAMDQVLPNAFSTCLLDYVRALLQLWRRKVPRASVKMLAGALNKFHPPASRAVLEYVQSKCSESLASPVYCSTNTSKSPPSTASNTSSYTDSSGHRSVLQTQGTVFPTSRDSARENISPVHRRLLLLACRVYAQLSAPSTDTETVEGVCIFSPSPSLGKALEHFGFHFSTIILTVADCHLLSSVLEYHNKHIDFINLQNCQIDDKNYEQLLPGLCHCQRLHWLDISHNPITDHQTTPLINTIRANNASLVRFLAVGLDLSSSGYARLVPSLAQCSALIMIQIGGSKCQVVKTNVLIALVLLAYCRAQVSPMFQFYIGDQGLVWLFPLLIRRRLRGFGLSQAGLTSYSAPLVRDVLSVQSDYLQVLALHANSLSDMFLSIIAPSLKKCRSLAVLGLTFTGLTSQSLAILAEILASCPVLNAVRIRANDFRLSANEMSAQFVSAVQECRELHFLEMPTRDLVNDHLIQLLDSAAATTSLYIRYG